MASNQSPTLNATVRQAGGKGAAKRVRREGLVPAVCYGFDTENLTIAVDPLEFDKIVEQPTGLNTPVTLELDDGQKVENVLLRDYQIDPVKRNLTHADFVAVDPNEPLRVKVPLKTEGESEGEKIGGRVHLIRREVEVLALPGKIPEALVVDVTGLGPEDAIMADDLEYPEDVEPAHTVDYALVRIQMPRAKIETVVAPAGTAAVTPTTEEGEELEGEAAEGAEGEEEGEPAGAAPPGA